MKLLFDKDNEGSAQIKSLLGFTDSNIKFEWLKPKVITATDLIIDLIGQPLYDSLVGIYEALSQSEPDKEFLNRVQAVILLDAYRNYAMSTTIAHTQNGRVNRLEDKEKIAWEWQIDNDNRKMERDYYKGVDSLIKFMDKNVSGWKSSEAYKLTHNLFIRKATEIDDFFHIDGSRLLFLKMAPGIRKAENNEIISRITKTRYDDLKTKLKENQPVDILLFSLIQEAIVYRALAWVIPRVSAQLFPEGFVTQGDNSRMTISARKSVEKYEAEAYEQRFNIDADDALIRLEAYIKKLSQPTNIIIEPIKPNFNPDDNFVDC